MKIRRITLLFSVCILVTNIYAQKKNGFTIDGHLAGLKDETKIYLVRNKPEGSGIDTIDQTKSLKERFKLKGKVPVEPEAYFIFFEKDTTKYSKPLRRITVVLENKPITLKGSIHDHSVEGIKVTGSVTHTEFVEYYQKRAILVETVQRDFQKTLEEYKHDLTISIDDALIKRDQAINNFQDEWMYNHLNSYLTPWLMMNRSYSLNELKSAYNKLSSRIQHSKYGKDLANLIILEEKTAIGTKAPNFSFPTPEGKSLSLKEVAAKGKITAVDFWASWCKPCRDDFPEMKRVFNKYHSKGLNILGVSLDRSESAWKNAIEKDGLPWFNVLQTDRGFARETFGITMIPTILLIDSEGRIIAKDIYGSTLEDKIKPHLD